LLGDVLLKPFVAKLAGNKIDFCLPCVFSNELTQSTQLLDMVEDRFGIAQIVVT
jgi:hypothetical protein